MTYIRIDKNKENIMLNNRHHIHRVRSMIIRKSRTAKVTGIIRVTSRLPDTPHNMNVN